MEFNIIINYLIFFLPQSDSWVSTHGEIMKGAALLIE